MPRLTAGLALGQLIGHGYFGDVHEALDPIHGRVAVKVLRPDPAETDAEWKARRGGLLKEGQNLRKAEHQNVVRVIQVLEPPTEDESLHLVLEFCGGGSVGALYEKGPLTTAKVRTIATEVAMGLEALHNRGMVHRDVKPANILLDDKGRAKISDFGLVSDDLIMGYASVQGYTDHIAPEVHAGRGTSVRTDVWAFGMTVYRLLHGHAWYSMDPPPHTQIPKGGFAGKLRWLPHVPDLWRRFLRKALHDDADARLQNFSQVLSALANLQCDDRWQPTVSPLGISWEREQQARRHRVRWLTSSPRSHSWDASSEPVSGNGRARRIGGSTGTVTRAAAIRELEAFFKS